MTTKNITTLMSAGLVTILLGSSAFFSSAFAEGSGGSSAGMSGTNGTSGGAGANVSGNVGSGATTIGTSINGTASGNLGTSRGSTQIGAGTSATNTASTNASGSNGTNASMNSDSSTSTSGGLNASGTGMNVTSGATSNMSWNMEDSYWRRNFSSRPYAESNAQYSTYQPAYRYGVDAYSRFNGRRFNTISDAELRADWERTGTSDMDWNDARDAVRDAYERMYNNSSRSSTSTGARARTSAR
jgi:hypothetical protein